MIARIPQCSSLLTIFMSSHSQHLQTPSLPSPKTVGSSQVPRLVFGSGVKTLFRKIPIEFVWFLRVVGLKIMKCSMQVQFSPSRGICSGFSGTRIRPSKSPLMFLPLGSLGGYFLLQHRGWTVCAHKLFHIFEEGAHMAQGCLQMEQRNAATCRTEDGQWSPVLVLQALHPWVCRYLAFLGAVGCWLIFLYFETNAENLPGALCSDQLPICTTAAGFTGCLPWELKTRKRKENQCIFF